MAGPGRPPGCGSPVAADGLWTWRDDPLAPGRAVVFDIDGVLSDDRPAASTFIERRPQDWESFFDRGRRPATRGGPPVAGGARHRPRDRPAHGRPARLRDVTVDWLERHGLRWDLLGMRPDADSVRRSELQAAGGRRAARHGLRDACWPSRTTGERGDVPIAPASRASTSTSADYD